MAQIVEDYVSFETAKLLREKRFKEPTLAYAYGQDMVAYYSQPRITDDYNVEVGRYPLPTLQMACKWLREVHNLFIEMHIQNNGSYIGYIYNTNGFGLIGWDKRRVSSSYEQACEAAIKFCLENLI